MPVHQGALQPSSSQLNVASIPLLVRFLALWNLASEPCIRESTRSLRAVRE